MVLQEAGPVTVEELFAVRNLAAGKLKISSGNVFQKLVAFVIGKP